MSRNQSAGPHQRRQRRRGGGTEPLTTLYDALRYADDTLARALGPDGQVSLFEAERARRLLRREMRRLDQDEVVEVRLTASGRKALAAWKGAL